MMQVLNWNEEQQQAIEACSAGSSVVITGSGGTGKTTLMKEAVRRCTTAEWMPRISRATKVLRAGEAGIVVVSYTRTAVNNIREKLEGAATCSTIHALLEFQPTEIDVPTKDGGWKKSRVFMPARDAMNPLPKELRTIVIDEAGIVSLDLFAKLLDALPNPDNVQFICLGDLAQLTPPYDHSILGFTLNHRKVVELTKVYRQALQSPILRFALQIKDGQTWGSNQFASICEDGEHGSMTVKALPANMDEFVCAEAAGRYLQKEWEAGRYAEHETIVICPFGDTAASKHPELKFSARNLNVSIAQFLGDARSAEIWEVRTGFRNLYLAVGDRVLIDKERGIIRSISPNRLYGGTPPQAPSKFLTRKGFLPTEHRKGATYLSVDDMLHEMPDSSNMVRAASAVVEVEMDDGELVILKNAGDFTEAKFSLGYAITAYKSQGQEWERVYIFTHKAHSMMATREFYYTAVTRAKRHCTLLCEPTHLFKMKQEVAGKTWQEKAAYFQQRSFQESLLRFPDVKLWLAEGSIEEEGGN
jgi:GTPase SAR1 family protein